MRGHIAEPSSELHMLGSIDGTLPKSNAHMAWKFLCWAIQESSFSIQFYNRNLMGSGLVEIFGAHEFQRFEEFLFELNAVHAQYNVFFDPNCSGYCGKQPRDNSDCFDYVALSLDVTSQQLGFHETRDSIQKDMVCPLRRPQGLPMPTACWDTLGGCAALWRTKNTMSLSDGLDLGDIVSVVLENEDFFAHNEKYLQLPYTVHWPSNSQFENHRLIEAPSLPWTYNLGVQPAQYEQDAFRHLVSND